MSKQKKSSFAQFLIFIVYLKAQPKRNNNKHKADNLNSPKTMWTPK